MRSRAFFSMFLLFALLWIAPAIHSASPVQPNDADNDNVITYSLDNNRVYRVAARPNATPEDVSANLDALSAGAEDHLLNVSPNGQWLVL